MIVMKFGGTSVGSGERMLEVAKIVASERERQPIVVVSAMSQVTNLLVELAAGVNSPDYESKVVDGVNKLRELHHQAVKALRLEKLVEEELAQALDSQIDNLAEVLSSAGSLGELTARGTDLVLSFGERLSIHLVTAALQRSGVAAAPMEASSLIVTDNNYGNAQPLLDESTQLLRPKLKSLLKKGVIPVITGFIGATRGGIITTLGRGGSDYSATIIGHCVGADEVWIWTDVNGVMTADPRLVKGAHTVSDLSYDEAAELSYFGAKVIHPRTMVPAALSNMPIYIKNTMAPNAPGTRISKSSQHHPSGAKAMTVLSNLALISVQGKGMQGVWGVAAKVFTTLAEHQVSVLFISQASSENNISLVVWRHDGERSLQALRQAFQADIATKNVEAVTEKDEVAMIAVVGEGMKSHKGIAGRIFSALGRADINVIAIAQGSSERNISFVVKENNAAVALQAIHDEFHLANGSAKGKA